ncbi:hypothetical protein [Lysobacter sp. A3-1-A15]|uniref:hypothetical protein n=1 Tax=Novilysobacter viscosus TaxID=3098602 RepID=UPI002EDBAB02
MIERLANVLKSLVLFTLIGPLVGYLVVAGAVLVGRPHEDATLFQFLFLALFAYPIGAAPAALTGLIASFMALRLKGEHFYVGVGLVGGGVTALFASGVGSPSEASWTDLGLAFVPGLAGGAVCAWIFQWPDRSGQSGTPGKRTPGKT